MFFSDFWANIILEQVFRNSAPGGGFPAAVYAALFTALPVRQTALPSGEVSGGSYARVAVTFGTAAAQRVLNSAAVTFANPTANWATAAGPVVACALMDASTSGQFIVATPLCAMIVLNGDPGPKIEIGGMKVALDRLMGAC